jgi:hypothetical protein
LHQRLSIRRLRSTRCLDVQGRINPQPFIVLPVYRDCECPKTATW